jgi:hypothetical protein
LFYTLWDYHFSPFIQKRTAWDIIFVIKIFRRKHHITDAYLQLQVSAKIFEVLPKELSVIAKL